MGLMKIRIGVQKKMINVVLVPLVILLIAILLMMSSVRTVASYASQDSQIDKSLLLVSEQIAQRFYRWDDDLNMAVLALQDHHPSMTQSLLADATTMSGKIFAQLTSTKRFGMSPDQVSQLTKELRSYATYSNHVITDVRAGNVAQATDTQLLRNEKISTDLVHTLSAISHDYTTRYVAVSNSLQRSITTLRVILVMIGLSAFILSMITALWLATSMARQIRRLTKKIELVADGDRTMNGLDNIPHDEIGDAMNALALNIKTLHQMEQNLMDQVTFQRSLLAAIPLPVYYKNSKGQSIGGNISFLEFHGVSLQKLLATTVYDFAPRELADFHQGIDASLLRGDEESFVYESMALDSEGKAHDVQFHKAVFRDSMNEVAGVIVAMVDITEQKKREQHIRYLNQLYAMLAQTNQSIVHCSDELTLFQEICRIAVEFGEMTAAWIGGADPMTGVIRPVIVHGDMRFVGHLQASYRTDIVEGLGDVGKAYRDQQVVIIQDYLQDERTRPWHDIASQANIGSAAAVPIFRADQIYAILVVYHSNTHIFDKTMMDLLTEMAMDIGYALNQLDLEMKRNTVQAQQRLLAKVFEQSNEGIAITDSQGNYLAINKSFTEITGFEQQELLSRTSGRKIPDEYLEMLQQNQTKDFVQQELWNRRKDGTEYLERISITRVHDGQGQVTNYITIIANVTEAKAAEQQVRLLAHYDPLTNLPNRTLLTDRINQAIHAAENKHEPFALMFLDLDHFKNINDFLGHRIGDLLLMQLAIRLTTSIREQDTVSRLGGDEFILLLPGMDESATTYFAQMLTQVLTDPYHIEGHELIASSSLGIALFPDDGDNWETLYRRADIAMYNAKQEGRNTFRFFSPEMQKDSERRLQLESALRKALERDEFELYYQPQISLHDESVVGVEALLRWKNPELGMVSPGEFIPLAEESGLILSIEEWVMRSAIMQMKRWLDQGLFLTTMAVNLSAVQLHQHNLAQMIQEILDEIELPAHYLELELTESAAMQQPDVAIVVLDDLHRCGIRISIDDFGTGYSSLAYLNRFHIDKIKIDQSFVRNIDRIPDEALIVDAVISLAKSLHLQTVAEGVETLAELSLVLEKGCDEVQGFYFSRPLPVDELVAWIHSHRLKLKN